MTQGIKNIELVLAQSDFVDLTEGKTAYERYNEVLRSIADYYSMGFVQTVAAFVALSPNNDYVGNLRSLITLIVGFKNNIPVEQITTSTYKQCRNRAYNYLTGEKDFLVETGGPKTINFYFNILKPKDTKYVTIDGHMYGVWHGERFRMVEVAHLKIPYSKIASDFKIVAKRNNLIPNQLQATLWFTWKRINNVIYNPQLSLLNQENYHHLYSINSLQKKLIYQ